MVMTTQARPIKPIRPTKPKCSYCKKTGHTADKCWKKHPHLDPQKQAKTELNTARNQPDRPSREAYVAEEEIALHSSIPEHIGTWYLDSAATSHISAYKELF
jgi:hypothetical protein